MHPLTTKGYDHQAPTHCIRGCYRLGPNHYSQLPSSVRAPIRNDIQATARGGLHPRTVATGVRQSSSREAGPHARRRGAFMPCSMRIHRHGLVVTNRRSGAYTARPVPTHVHGMIHCNTRPGACRRRCSGGKGSQRLPSTGSRLPSGSARRRRCSPRSPSPRCVPSHGHKALFTAKSSVTHMSVLKRPKELVLHFHSALMQGALLSQDFSCAICRRTLSVLHCRDHACERDASWAEAAWHLCRGPSASDERMSTAASVAPQQSTPLHTMMKALMLFAHHPWAASTSACPGDRWAVCRI